MGALTELGAPVAVGAAREARDPGGALLLQLEVDSEWQRMFLKESLAESVNREDRSPVHLPERVS